MHTQTTTQPFLKKDRWIQIYDIKYMEILDFLARLLVLAIDVGSNFI